MISLERFNKIISAQETRGFDKYILAPLLIFVGVKYKALPKKIRRILVGAGVFQIFYGWTDYMEIQAKIVEAAKQAVNKGEYNG